MKIKNVVFSILCLLVIPNIAVAQCEDGEQPLGEGCEQCEENFYCAGGEKQSCPDGFPKSAKGAKSEKECYKECQVTDGGTAVGSGTQYNESDAKCKITSCSENYTKVTNAPTDKATEFDGYCLETEKDCSKLLNAKCTVYKNGCQETDSSVSQGDVTGKAKITDATNGTYNLTTACKCKVAGRHTNGTHYIDYYSYSSSCFISNKYTSEVTKCDAGYCKQSSSSILACQQTPAGYYHADDGGKDCKPCPAGQTSNAGSSSQSDCHYTSETQFCDDNGCISFPMM